ncbi:MAG: hypothetical protein ACYDEH_12855 [Acidimicrobiales bacterium]
MYRSTAKRLKRVSLWTLTTLAALGGGVATATLSSSPSAKVASVAGAKSTAAVTTLGKGTTSPTGSASATEASVATATSVTQGAVVQLSSTLLTVRYRSGAVSTYALTPTTVVLSVQSRVGLSSVKVGDAVFVVPLASRPTTAATIGVLPASLGGEHDATTED